MTFKVVEYEQNELGKLLSQILPENLKPAMRTGEPVSLSGKFQSFDQADKVRQIRNNQLKIAGRYNRFSVEIEEEY